MTQLFTVLHSKLAPQYLGELIRNSYGISGFTECRLIACQMNDTYLVNICGSKYVLRVYRQGRKTLPEIRYEMEILNFLNSNGVNVSSAIKKLDGDYVITLNAPEGTRYAGLFTFIEGKTPYRLGKIDFYRAGKALAEIHKTSDLFQSQLPVNELNLQYLLDKSLETLKCNIKVKENDFRYLEELSDKLKAIIEIVPKEKLDQGFCHGDCNPENIKVDAKGNITFLDFDCCGTGSRTYDLATFFYTIMLNIPMSLHPLAGLIVRERINAWCEKFLAGYTSVRSFSNADISLIIPFIAVRHIWTLGLRAANINHWGLKFMNEDILKGSLKFIRTFENIYLDRKTKRIHNLLPLFSFLTEIVSQY